MAEYIEGMCCDCIMQGPCCSWDENESCPRHKDDGSCWVPANHDNPELNDLCKSCVDKVRLLMEVENGTDN